MVKEQDWKKISRLRKIVKDRKTPVKNDRLTGKPKGGVDLNDETVTPYAEKLAKLEAKIAKEKEEMSTGERVDTAAAEVMADASQNKDEMKQFFADQFAKFCLKMSNDDRDGVAPEVPATNSVASVAKDPTRNKPASEERANTRKKQSALVARAPTRNESASEERAPTHLKKMLQGALPFVSTREGGAAPAVAGAAAKEVAMTRTRKKEARKKRGPNTKTAQSGGKRGRPKKKEEDKGGKRAEREKPMERTQRGNREHQKMVKKVQEATKETKDATGDETEGTDIDEQESQQCDYDLFGNDGA